MRQQVVILFWVLYAASIIVLQDLFDGLITPEATTKYAILANLPWVLSVLFPVLYRYLLYRYCGCCEKSNDELLGQQNGSLAQPLIENTVEAAAVEEAQNQSRPTISPPRRVRYTFLDNVKVFLTVMVVCHHIACAFAPIGDTIIQVPGEVPGFTSLLGLFLLLNQSYFMTLFFFISAFFVPSSYAKGRERFISSKWKRIFLPALVMTFVIYPISWLFSIRYTSGTWLYIFVDKGPTWYLYWLLLLNWVYMSIIESTDTSSVSATTANNDVTEVNRTQGEGGIKIPFPSTWTRLFYGVTMCGFLLEALRSISPGGFGGMPDGPGSWTADFLMFYAGILAKKHGWLEKDLAEQLDMPLCVFFPLFFIEVLIYVASLIIQQTAPTPLVNFIVVVAQGAYCVDMSLALLIVFQRWFNYETKLSKILARSAYCAYLIHTLVILATTVIYLEVYRNLFGEGTDVGKIVGGYFFVLVSTQAILWPLSYGLTRLPILRDII